MTALVHSPAERDAAVAAAAALFGRSELASWTSATLASVVAELGGTERPGRRRAPRSRRGAGGAVGWWRASGGPAGDRRGGAYLNNERVSDPDARLADEDLLYGRYVVSGAASARWAR